MSCLQSVSTCWCVDRIVYVAFWTASDAIRYFDWGHLLCDAFAAIVAVLIRFHFVPQSCPF